MTELTAGAVPGSVIGLSTEAEEKSVSVAAARFQPGSSASRSPVGMSKSD